MAVSHHSHHYALFFFQKSLSWLYWVSVLRTLAFAITSTFTFIFIYRLGSEAFIYSWNFSSLQRGFLAIALYVLLFRLACIGALFFMNRLVVYIRLSGLFALANLLMVGKFLLFIISLSSPLVIFAAAFVAGIENAAATPAYETMFARLASRRKVGSDVGAFAITNKLLYIVMPVIFGTIIAIFGFLPAFLSSIVCLLLSSFLFFFSTWKEETSSVPWSSLTAWMRQKNTPLVLLATTGRYLHDEVLALWPVYIFLIIGSIAKVGGIFSVALFISLVFSYLGGWSVDHTRRNKGFFASGIGLAGIWATRTLSTSFGLIVISDIIHKVAESFYAPSFEAQLYRDGKGRGSYAFFLFLELVLSVIALLVWIMLIAIFLLSTDPWRVLFLLAGGGVFLSLLLYRTSDYD